MAVLYDVRREALAQGLACGMSKSAAARAAGYVKHSGHVGRLCTCASIVARVAHIVEETPRGGSSDLAPVINELMRLAALGGTLGTAAGLTAAKQLLVEAARLKERLPLPEMVLEPEMSREEWIATYARVD